MTADDDMHSFHVLAVCDLEAATPYFRDVLGFRVQWEEASDWRLLKRGKAALMVGWCPNERPARDIGSHSYFGYFHAGDVDALHAEFTGRGAIILQTPQDKPWGMREMLVGTPEGHRMMFGQELGRAPPPALAADDLQ
jgi:catechol 2,3-dioxygenase-like lactoylglutathione lyase family enzyme